MTLDKLKSRTVVTPNGCWEWAGAKDRSGYGWSWHNGRNFRTHRLAYELANGRITKGLFICHKCDNPPCCNPDHLFEGTNGDNFRDAIRKGRAVPPTSDNRGERNGSVKLNAETISKIRGLRAQGWELLPIAREFGISRTQVHNIVTRKKWAHLQ
jgi:hypothetical protein